jgi:hypothetical protein
MAVVWSGGGRRYFTRKAALRGAAKHIIRQTLRATGDEAPDLVTFQEWVAQLVGKIERGERPELDFEATTPSDAQSVRPDGGEG